ncbi:Aspartate--tRNA(Asp/Asn) ligase [uncultured archaeon]|nr:Aspartate--tRNA(Asp/Asn) ligase [uncultured archaeon]
MGREELIVKERIRKLDEIKKLGIDPYPHKYEPKDYSIEIKENNSKLKENEKSKVKANIAGRVMTVRDLGKLIFATLQDSKGRIQIILQKEETEEKDFELFKKYIDIGDIIGCVGTVMKTKTGEVSVLVKKVTLLSKSILPLPEKWHGLSDKEERYRKRYLDLIMNPETKNVFEKRTLIFESIREILKKKGFIEVETPYLNTTYGGARAKPFKTHLNALDMDLYLAISPELFLKRLIVGGYDKIFTMARCFRNEGIDRWHNPEFTNMEIYWAYADYNDMMDLFEEIYEYCAKKVNGTTKVDFKGKVVDFKRPWKRMTMCEAIKKWVGIDVDKMTKEDLVKFVCERKLECMVKKDSLSWGEAVQAVFEEFCEEKMDQPTFIIDHPLESTPLCKLHRNDKLCRLIERFEPFCMGTELGNAYSELNDPILQRTLLEGQQKALTKGDEEANPLDEDFINAIEIGMPPTGGLGMGIDRMIILLTGQESIRDILFFPFMRKLSSTSEDASQEHKEQEKVEIKGKVKIDVVKKKK